jgi:tetratricopeptide (TPR) repeat protein
MERQQVNVLDVVAVVGAVGGSIASLVSQQVAFAAIPLSVSVALNVVNRRQMMNQMLEQQNAIAQSAQLSQQMNSVQDSVSELSHFQQQSLAQVNQQIQAQQTTFATLSGQFGEFKHFSANLTQETQQLKDAAKALQAQQQQFEETLVQLREMEDLSQKMCANPDTAEFYFTRGLSHERLRDKQKAIEDYTAAIDLAPNYAQAYHHRGILNNEVGHRKKAIDDLRKAAQLYFEQEDIENYEAAKDLSKELYQLPSSAKNEAKDQAPQTLLVGGLFS